MHCNWDFSIPDIFNSNRQRYTIKQRVNVVQAYYENGYSNQNVYLALRDFLFFVQFDRSNVQTRSVGDVRAQVQDRTVRTAENTAVICDSAPEEPFISTHHYAHYTSHA